MKALNDDEICAAETVSRRGHARALLVAPVVGLLCMAPRASLAQGADAQDLAKQVQNPLAHLISVPFQNNFNPGTGSEDDLQYVLNVQPVVPFRLTNDWNLITRTIVPLVYQPQLGPGIGETWGLGDINTTLALSPARPGAVIWGIGPIIAAPTATDDVVGQGKLSIGPSAVALMSKGAWLFGTLVNNLFSIAGDGDRQNVNQMLIQPFANYNLRHGWYITASPIITANWEKDNDRWVVPLGGGVGRVFRVGNRPMNASLQAFHHVEHPDSAGDWSVRFQHQLLFPK